MELHLREAGPTDTDVLVGILIASKVGSIPQLIGEHDRDEAFWTDRWRSYLNDGSRAQGSLGDGFALPAELSGKAVAFAAWHHTTRHGTNAELESIYVVHSAQRAGVGTALLRAVASRLLADGSRSLCVGYDPRSPYKRFYFKHGAVELNPHWAIWRPLDTLALDPPG